MGRRILPLIVALFILISAGCIGQDASEEAETPPVNEEISGPEETEQIPDGRIITLGLEGQEQEVAFKPFHNQWLSIWYDADLEMEEDGEQVSFYNIEEDVSFIVSLDEEGDIEAETLQPLLDEGYEIYNEYSDSTADQVYILHDYDVFMQNRHNVDLYILDDQGQTIIIECHMPDMVLEKYEPRFQYMLESISL
jgi:hypothetical protein